MGKFLVLVALLVVGPTARAEPVLVGHWESDRELTIQFNKERAKLEDKSLKFLAQLMGRMTVTFTKTTVTYEMNDWEFETEAGEKHPFKGFKEVQPYRQIGQTPKSIAILSRDPVTGEEGITVFNFSGINTMWIYSGRTGESVPMEHLREYFVRKPWPAQSSRAE